MTFRTERRGLTGFRSLAVLTAAVAMTTASVGATVATPASMGDVRTGVVPVPQSEQDGTVPFRLVQANINKDMSAKKFRADVSSVMAQAPDIIAYNEVHGRADVDLVPAGFAMYRTPGPRTGWAPVAWDTAVWTAVGQGTVQISKRPAKYKSGMVGVRYANWVTLVNAEDRQLSVISAHVAPNGSGTAQLLEPSLKVLSQLAGELSAQGPVVLAGDLNMGYRSSRYQPKVLEAVGLRSTYDILKTSFVTHRRGGIIDYVFIGADDQLAVDQHFAVPMQSDHSAVVADLRLIGTPQASTPGEPQDPTTEPSSDPSFSPTRMVVARNASKSERRQIRRLQLRAIRAAGPGAAIHVATESMQGQVVYKALTAAYDRGVDVTVLLGRKRLTGQDKALRKLLGTRVTDASWFRRAPKAWTTSRVVRARALEAQKPTTLLISRAGNTRAFSLVSNTKMDKAPLRTSSRHRSTARVTVDLPTYDKLYEQYLAQVGRAY